MDERDLVARRCMSGCRACRLCIRIDGGSGHEVQEKEKGGGEKGEKAYLKPGR